MNDRIDQRATLTPNLGLYKPDIGGDYDAWGSELNANFDVLDNALLPGAADARYLSLEGGTMGGPLIYTATGGTVARSAQGRAADVANVLDFGADPTGVADSSAAINEAVGPGGREVFLPAGIYRLNFMASLLAGTTLSGASVKTTFLLIDDQFDPSALGVLSLNGFETASPFVRNLSLVFAQPTDTTTTTTASSGIGTTTITVASVANVAVNNYVAGPNAAIPFLATITNITGNVLTLSTPIVSPGVNIGDALRFGPSRANMLTLAQGGTSGQGGTGIKYPPAIYTPNSQCNRPHLSNIYIGGAWDGIYAPGAAIHLENIEMGALNKGWNTDGVAVLDSVHVHSWRSWLYGFTADGRLGAFNTHHDGQVIGWNLGRIDGLNASNITFVDAKLVRTPNAVGEAPCTITGLQLDGNNANLEMSQGSLSIIGVYFTGSALAGTNKLNQTGGRLIVSDFRISCGAAPSAAIGLSGGRMHLMDGELSSADGDTVQIAQSGGGLVVTGCYFDNFPTRTVPLISQTGGAITFNGNTLQHITSGVAVSVTVDNLDNNIRDNYCPGWSFVVPTGATLGNYDLTQVDGAWGSQLILGKTNQGGRIDFRRGSNGAAQTWLGYANAASANAFMLQQTAGGATITLDAHDPNGLISFQVNGTEYAHVNNLQLVATQGLFAVTSPAGPSFVNITAQPGQQRLLGFQTAGVYRWGWLCLATPPEVGDGSNVGSDISLVPFSDTGTQLASAITATRATGQVSIPKLTSAALNCQAFGLSAVGATAGRQTVSGAKGGNAALASVIAALVAFGLVTDTTTA